MGRQYKESNISWVGLIPTNWCVLRNKNAFVSGKDLVGKSSSTTQLLSLTTKGIKAIKEGETSGKVPESYDTYQVVKPNNLVMCLFDLDCSAVFAGISNYEGMISPAYKVLTCKATIIPQYANYWFIYVFDGRKFMHYSKNIRYSLTYDEFSALKIVLPPLNEQKKIADYLDKKCGEIDRLIDLQEQMIVRLAEYKQSVITEAVTKGITPEARLVPSGIDWIGNIPEGWQISKVKWQLRERKEYSENGEEEPLSMSQKYGLIPTKAMDIIPNMASSFVGAKLVHEGDLVFNKLKAHLGVFAVSKYNGLVSPDYAVYFKRNNTSMKYLEYLFKTPQYIAEFRKLSTGVGAGLTRLYTNDLFSISCLLPPIKEQEAIAQYIQNKCTEIDNLIAIKQQKIETLNEYKKSIIFECVTGKKDIN